MKLIKLICLAGVLVLLNACRTAAPSEVSEKAAIRATVDRMFDALSDRDADVWTQIMLEDGAWFEQHIDNDWASELIVSDMNAKIRQLALSTRTIEENYWSERIFVDGPIAIFWSPYVAFEDGELIGCGVNSFQLVKVSDEWKIASIVFNQRTLLCSS